MREGSVGGKEGREGLVVGKEGREGLVVGNKRERNNGEKLRSKIVMEGKVTGMTQAKI